MQFKHPELLWALFLLLIPILIHLFQLRRFKKTPFTNVKLLKKVVSASRKSSTLKKWLVLFSRLGILTFLILAFAGPFTANPNALVEKQYIFYLDNSFSMQAKTGDATVLQQVVQDLLRHVPPDLRFDLITNNDELIDVTVEEAKVQLLNLAFTATQLTHPEISLKAKKRFGTGAGQEHLVLISDFQERLKFDAKREDMAHLHLVPVRPDLPENLAIDSVFMEGNNELVALLSSNGDTENTAVSLYEQDKLMAKTAATFSNNRAKVRFSLPEADLINGKLVVTDNGLEYDNQFYFTKDQRQKIRILSINGAPKGFLDRLFAEDAFVLSHTTLDQLNYSSLEEQNLIVLNEVPAVPNALIMALRTFVDKGGSVAIVPAPDSAPSEMNPLLSAIAKNTFKEAVAVTSEIAKVNTAHPLFSNVFDADVANFQYPTVQTYYPTGRNEEMALGFKNGDGFLLGNGPVYLFTAALSEDNSNFKYGPLIVPTFYNMAVGSLQLPPLFSTIGSDHKVEIPIALQEDDVLTVRNAATSFIPQQQVLSKKVTMQFNELPEQDGKYSIENKEGALQDISFNYHRAESHLAYTDRSALGDYPLYGSLEGFFGELQKNSAVNEFWKWFVILALGFVLLEMALQKFLK
ncbi:BatA domain-containing protein [Maribacter sp. 2307ULW6-5]|uniref:BatA domain-containing protein n=1 Tax=Maribacter sp. 2307ULW6-5 TaxID=3386275 RepID=UPI0039BCE934